MKQEQATTPEQVIDDMEAAFNRNDLDGLVALFAEDATIESYLVTRVFNRKGRVPGRSLRAYAGWREIQMLAGTARE